MSAPVIYTSDDAGAPVIDNATDGLTNLQMALKAILVDGYGAKSAAGWTSPYSSSPGSTNDHEPRMFVPGAGPVSYYRIVEVLEFNSYSGTVYETATGISTYGVQWGQDFASSARPSSIGTHKWICIADDRTCYFFMERVLGSGEYAMHLAMGKWHPYNPADVYSAMAWNIAGGFDSDVISGSIGGGATGYIMRNYLGTSVYNPASPYATLSLTGDRIKGAAGGTILRGLLPYPHPPDNRIWLSPIYVADGTGGVTVRGKVRGFWQWLHPINGVADRDVFAGVGDLAGKSFIIIKTIPMPSGEFGVAVIETSNTWET